MNWSKFSRLVAPSILSADFSKLASEVEEVEKNRVELIHLDVMDGHFVPNLTMGPVVLKSLRPTTKLFLDCHLMVDQPDQWIDPFAKAGADCITFHIEACQKPLPLIKKIKSLKCRAGLSLNPNTPIEMVIPFLKEVDLILLMSVFPGFGGQKFIEESYSRVEELARHQKEHAFLIEIDGGISDENAKQLSQLGVNIFVAGSYIFKEKDRKIPIDRLREAIG